MHAIEMTAAAAPVASRRQSVRRHIMSAAVVSMSVGMTAVMSLLFHRSIHYDMIATGFICALVIDRIINRISGHYRQRLAAANETLERRVHERTAELRDANLALRQAAAAEAALRDELIARDRMATAGQLAAGVSHEIRSPLSVITLVVAELEAQLPAAQPEVGALIADISDSAERIALILRDLSSLARPIDDPLAPVDLDAALASAGRLAAYKLDKGATLECPALGLPPVIGNAPRLVQLFLNLIVNAARATREDAPNTIRISGQVDGDAVALSISDTGTGMSAETRARLFEPFFTTGAARGGTGLGLTICRSIAERFGGSIAVTSELGVGTTVTVKLRRAP